MEKTVVLLFVTWCIILVSTLCRGQEVWRQGCPEGDFGGQASGLMCGERPALLANVETDEGLAKPYEFPWTCMVFSRARGEQEGEEEFVGSCVIVPNSPDNDMTNGTNRVIMTPSRMMKFATDRNGGPDFFIPREFIVRVVEYDDTTKDDGAVVTVDYEVVTIRSWFNTVEQPDRGFNFQRSDYNLVTLFLDRNIDTAGGKFNAACFPQCRDMFSDFTFRNGTGSRCWVTGWDRQPNTREGAPSYTLKKIHLPLVEFNKCQALVRAEFRRQGVRGSFSLSRDSEVCAMDDENLCKGDGGGALVCQGQPSGRWYVVGLISWGLADSKCGSAGVPGMYASVHGLLEQMIKDKRF